MRLQYCKPLNSSALASQKTSFFALSHHKIHFSCNYSLGRFRSPTRRTYKFNCVLQVGLENIAEVMHNKVLIAAGVSAAIGQLSKPFTGSLLYGRDFDLKAAFQAGGFPSTHSSIGLLSLPSVGIVRSLKGAFRIPFSAQQWSKLALSCIMLSFLLFRGMRREVGIHAKALNKLLHKTQVNSRILKDKDNAIDDDEWRA